MSKLIQMEKQIAKKATEYHMIKLNGLTSPYVNLL